MQGKEKPVLFGLDVEVFFLIFNYLDSPSLASVSLACHLFYSIAKSYSLSKKLHPYKMDFEKTPNASKQSLLANDWNSQESPCYNFVTLDNSTVALAYNTDPSPDSYSRSIIQLYTMYRPGKDKNVRLEYKASLYNYHLNYHLHLINLAKIPGTKRLVATFHNGNIVTQDYYQCKDKQSFTLNTGRIYGSAITKEGILILAHGQQNTAKSRLSFFDLHHSFTEVHDAFEIPAIMGSGYEIISGKCENILVKNKKIIILEKSKAISIWDFQGKELLRIPGSEIGYDLLAPAICLLPNNQLVMLANKKTMFIWDLNDEKLAKSSVDLPLNTFYFGFGCKLIALSDGVLAITGIDNLSQSNSIYIIDIVKKKCLQSLTIPSQSSTPSIKPRIDSFTLNYEGEIIAITCPNQSSQYIELHTWRFPELPMAEELVQEEETHHFCRM